MVLKWLKVKDVSFNLSGTGEMKWGLKNVLSNTLEVHRVAVSPHERAACAAARSPLTKPGVQVDKGAERIVR